MAYLGLFLLDGVSAWLDLFHYFFYPMNMREAFRRKLRMRREGVMREGVMSLIKSDERLDVIES